MDLHEVTNERRRRDELELDFEHFADKLEKFSLPMVVVSES